MAETITVPEYDLATTLSFDDLCYLIQGTGTDRDKKFTLSLLYNFVVENYSPTILETIVSQFTKKNLVYNGDFFLFSNRNLSISTFDDYNHPDGWVYTDDGSDAQIGYDSANFNCKVVTSSDGTSMTLTQGIHEFLRWEDVLKSQYVTGKFEIKGSSNITVKIYDGVSTVSEVLSGTGSIEEIELQIEVDSAATGLWVEISTSSTSETIEIYNVYFNTGTYAIKGLPCQIERIGIWNGIDEDYPDNVFEANSIEIPSGYTRLESWLNGRFGTGSNSRSKVPEFQGRFFRIWDNAAGNDPDSATRTDRGDGTTGDYSGTKEASAMWGHRHTFTRTSSNQLNYDDDGYVYNSGTDSNNEVLDPITDGTHGTPNLSSESRPININILSGIRWC